MASHSSTLVWRIPWTEEPGRLQSMGSLRVRHDWATSLSTFHFHALEKEMATHSSILAWRIPRDGGAWWAAIYGVAQSRTRLTRLSSSSSSSFRNYSCRYSEGFYFYKNRNQKCRKELQHSDYYMELCSGERNCACPMFKHLFQSWTLLKLHHGPSAARV